MGIILSKFDKYKKTTDTYIYPHKHCLKCGQMIEETETYCVDCLKKIEEKKQKKRFKRKNKQEQQSKKENTEENPK